MLNKAALRITAVVVMLAPLFLPVAGVAQSKANNGAINASADAAAVSMMSDYFDDIVFGSEFKGDASPPGVISRWSGTVAISLQGRATKELVKTASTHLNHLAKLTGLKFRQVKRDDPAPGISLVFVKRAEMNIIKGPGIPSALVEKLASSGGCYFIAFHKPPEKIIKAIIVVNVERTADALTSCLLEELTQSLGLPNDSNNYRPSIFSDSDRLLQLSRHDEILLRTLYDPRLKAGLSRTEAAKQVPAIISDWHRRLPQ